MSYKTDQNLWIGSAYDQLTNGFAGECKYWVDNSVVQPALGGVDLASNIGENNSYQWEPSTTVVDIASHLQGNIQNVVQDAATSIQAGDIIQMAKSDGSSPNHTVIVGKIDQDGIWIFDSNGRNNDATPRYRKLYYSSLNTYDLFTIYRIQ